MFNLCARNNTVSQNEGYSLDTAVTLYTEKCWFHISPISLYMKPALEVMTHGLKLSWDMNLGIYFNTVYQSIYNAQELTRTVSWEVRKGKWIQLKENRKREIEKKLKIRC